MAFVTPVVRHWMEREIASVMGPCELFLVPASASVTKAMVCVILSVGWCI